MEIKCEVKTTLPINKIVPFQGDLKKRTEQDIVDLVESLNSDGLLMPLAIWRISTPTANGNVYDYKLLDGHGRLQAFRFMGLGQDFEVPVVYIDAKDEATARKALLQITSSYGKVNKKGLATFSAPVSGYKAPIMQKVNKKPAAKKTETVKTDTMIRIKVPTDKAKEVVDMLRQVSYIEVLN